MKGYTKIILKVSVLSFGFIKFINTAAITYTLLLCGVIGVTTITASEPNKVATEVPLFSQTKLQTRTTKNPSNVIVRGKMGLILNDYLSRAEKFGYHGIVLAAKDGEVILKKAYGYADRENGILLSVATRFPIASEEKIFTAGAIIKLEEMGKLKLTDSIAEYFDNVPEDKKAIAIHHLLTHSAGLPAYAGPDEELITRDTLVERMMAVKLRSKPGEKYYYSNPSYSLLAVVIEKVSGKTFDEFLQKELFQPAGMTQTNFTTNQPNSNQILCGYLGMETKCRDAGERKKLLPDGLSWTLRGNAGRFSTVDDLYKWYLALNNNSVLSQASLDKINSPHILRTANQYAGYSWFISTTKRGTREASMSGGDQIVGAYFQRFLDEDAVIIQFTNNSWGVSRRINNLIPEIIFGTNPPVLPAAEVKLTKQELLRYAGTYRLPSRKKFSVVFKNNQLAVASIERGIARVLVSSPKISEQKLLANIEARTSYVINGLANNNLEPIRETLWRSEKFEDEKAYWTPAWKEWTNQWGAFESSEVVATITTGDTAEKILNTYVLIHFQNGSRLVNFKQNKDGYFYIDTSTTDFLPAYFQFVPLMNKEFVTYNFHLKSESKMRFQTNKNNQVTGVIISNNAGQVSAKRTR